MLGMQAQSFSQEISYDRISVDGSRHQIHRPTTISHVTPITRERRPGFSKAAHITNGSQQVPTRSSGFMENVRPVPFRGLTPPNDILDCSWLRQEHILVRKAFAVFVKIAELLVSSSTIIQDMKIMCDAGQASMAYFYFDFRDIRKQHWRDLVPSLLTQLSAQSGPSCDILSHIYSDHRDGAQQPNDDILTQCLKDMLTLPDQSPVYLILDALDECPDTSEVPSPRNRILQLVKELVNLQIPHLRICVTSRPEFDIRDVLEPLTSRRVSLHDQSGQKHDIADYVRSVVYSDSEPYMRRWRKEDKEFVIEILSTRADGM